MGNKLAVSGNRILSCARARVKLLLEQSLTPCEYFYMLRDTVVNFYGAVIHVARIIVIIRRKIQCARI